MNNFCAVLFSFFIVSLGQPSRIVWLCPVAACLGFALFFRAISSVRDSWRRFWTAVVWFSGIQVIQLSWMSSIEYQGYYILLVYAVISCCIGLQFGLLTRWIPQRSLKVRDCAALAALWTLFEWSRLLCLCGFSWNPVGIALSFHPIPLQSAALFGVFGLSFWVMFTNLGVGHSKNWKKASQWFAVALLPYLFGVIHLQYQQHNQTQLKPIRVALVQTGLLPSQKVLLTHRASDYILPMTQWENILSYLPDKQWDLIVLPEAAVPHGADYAVFPLSQVQQIWKNKWGEKAENTLPSLIPPFARQRFVQGKEVVDVSNLFFAQALANVCQADVIVGLDYHDSWTNNFYNSAFLLRPDHECVQRYDKQVLLPLAEYLPCEWMRNWTKSYGIFDFFSCGKEDQELQARIPLSVSICYEETFPEIIRRNAQAKVALVNVTNDNYYPNSSLAEQHFSHARLRTVENGRPLIRACNSGVTAVVDSYGYVVARLGEKGEDFEHKQGVLECSFVPHIYPTLFSLWGDKGIVILSCLILIYYAIRCYFHRKISKLKN